MSVSAIVCEIKVRKHPNADRIQLGTCAGHQVVVGLDIKDGTRGILFPCELQLSEKFCEANDLISRTDPETGKKTGGYFPNTRRVRAQKFRGEISDGFWCEFNHLEKMLPLLDKESRVKFEKDMGALKLDDEFTILGNTSICQKYIPKGTRSQRNNCLRIAKRKNIRFPEHFDTKQFRFEHGKIPAGALIYITEKLHGCVDRETIVDSLEYGETTIGKLVDGKVPIHIKGMDLATGEEVFAPVESFHFEPDSDDWYEIELEDGTKLTITGNNPVWLPELKCYRRADELKENDTVLTVKEQ